VGPSIACPTLNPGSEPPQIQDNLQLQQIVGVGCSSLGFDLMKRIPAVICGRQDKLT